MSLRSFSSACLIVLIVLTSVMTTSQTALAQSNNPLPRSQRPDLYITKVQIVPNDYPTTEDDLFLAVTIKNKGKSNAGSFVISAEDEDLLFETSRSVKSLKKNRSKTIYLPLDGLEQNGEIESKRYTFSLMVDAYNTVRESRENNNLASYDFMIHPADLEEMPTLTVSEAREIADVTAPRGAQRVNVMDLTFNVNASSDVYLDSFTLGHRGNSLSEISAVGVFQEYTHYGLGQIEIANNRVIFNFPQNYGSPLIKAGSSFKIQLKVDVSPQASSGSTHQFYIDEFYAHTPNKPQNSGLNTYFSTAGIPTSNWLTVGNSTSGILTITPGQTALNPLAGQTDQAIASFNLRTSGETAMLKAISLQIAGAASNPARPFKNLLLIETDTGRIWSRRDDVDPKKRFIFIINDDLEIGTSERHFKVVADPSTEIPGGSQMMIYLPHPNYLYAISETSQMGLTVESSNYDNSANNGQDASWSVVGPVSNQSVLSITVAGFPETPIFLEIPQGKPDNQFVTYNFQTGNQPVILNRLTIHAQADTNNIGSYINSVTLQSDRYRLTKRTNSSGTAIFGDLNLTLPANSLTKFKVLAEAGRGAASYPMLVSLGILNASDIEARDQSGNQIQFPSNNFPLNSNRLDIVDSGGFIVRQKDQLASTTVAAGTAGVEMLRFGAEATLEDFKIENLILPLTGQNELTRVILTDEAGTIYGSAGVRSDANGRLNFSISPSSLTIKAGTQKLLLVKADISSTAPANSTYQLSLNNLSGIGGYSQVRKNLTPDLTGRVVKAGPGVTVGTMIVRSKEQNPNMVVMPGQSTVMLHFGLEAQKEAFTIKTISLDLIGPANITAIVLSDDLGQEPGVVYGRGTFTTGEGRQYVFFAPNNLVIPANEAKHMIMTAYFSDTSQSGTTNRLVLKVVSGTGASSNITQTSYVSQPGNIITVGPVTSGQPDLIVSNVFFDEEGRLKFTVKNIGTGQVTGNLNNAYTVVKLEDGTSGGYDFNSFPDQAWKNPGGSSTIWTGWRLAGTNRVISVTTDNSNQVAESNENNNNLTVTITPPAQSGADFIISDLSRNSDESLVILVKNKGTAASTPTTGSFRVIVNEQTVGDWQVALPALAQGQVTAVTPSSTVKISQGGNVRVLLNTYDYVDIDNMNGVRQETFKAANLTTRAELARLAVETAGLPISTTGGPHFSDLNPAHPDYQYVETLVNANIMKGYPDGTFGPDQGINRAEASKIIALLFALPKETSGGPHYQDVQSQAWYYDSVETIFHYIGYSNSDSTSYFYPATEATDSFTRDYTLNILDRILNNLAVSAAYNLSAQAVTSQTQTTFLNFNIQALKRTATVAKIQVTIVDEQGNNYPNASELFDSLSLMEGERTLTTAGVGGSFVELRPDNLSLADLQTHQIKVVGKIKATAPVGKKFRIVVKKTSLFSPSGVMAVDDQGVNLLINNPNEAKFKLINYTGSLNTIVIN